MIRVRIADALDQPRLIAFIRDHWSSTHIFTQRPDVFAWQYLQSDGRLNMVIAEDDTPPDTPVLGVLGFIPLGRFAPTLGDRDLMLAIWKVREQGAPPGLGLRLLKFLQAELSPRLIAAIGTSKMVRPIYEVLGYEVGELRHSALFHPGRREALRVARGVPASAFEPAVQVPARALELVPIDESASTRLRDAVDRVARVTPPTKSWDYLVQRYLRHPWYRYETHAVRCESEVVAVVVWRAVEAAGARVLRIVDIVGDTAWLGDARFALQQAVVARDAEYVDLVQWGVDESALEGGGFVGTSTHPELVLPNYFSPFEPRNVEIELAFKLVDGSGSPVQLYRADSDQDRPNLPSELDPVAAT